MIYGVVGFLIFIGVLVFISTIGSKNEIDPEKINEDIYDKKTDPEGYINFTESENIPDDLRKLREKLNKEQDSYASSRKMIISLSAIVIIFIAGLFVIFPIYIRNAYKKLNEDNSNSNNNTEEIKEEIDNDTTIENNDENNNQEVIAEETIVYEKLNIKEKQLYMNSTLSEELVDKETIIKNFTYQESINSIAEFILVDKDKNVLKFNSSSEIEKYLNNEIYNGASFEKRFVINGDGVLEKYIYTYKK